MELHTVTFRALKFATTRGRGLQSLVVKRLIVDYDATGDSLNRELYIKAVHCRRVYGAGDISHL